METLADWFGLKEGRDDFYIQTNKDYGLFFARADLHDRIQQILNECYRGKNPPKFVIYGWWGTGKTHTLRNIEWALEQNEQFPARVVFIELPDITAASTFTVAQALLLDALGFETVRTWVNAFIVRHQGDTQARIKDLTQSEDIAKAFMSLVGFGENARTCWDWLRGLPLSSAEAKAVGLPPALKESHQLVSVLRMFGQMSKDLDDSMLVFLMDEGEKLAQVTKADSVNHWKNAFRILSDTAIDECGLVIAGAFNDIDQMPDILNDLQIVTRFGEPNYIQLSPFQSAEAQVFVSDLLEEWVDPQKREAIVSVHQSEADGESIEASTFPFTSGGLAAFVEYATRDGGITSPRDIQGALTRVANRAMDDERHLLSGGYVRNVQL